VTASLREIKVYTTFPHRCSYLSDREATTLFVDPRQRIGNHLYTQLSQLGFRRSGDHVYRPHCARCNACIASRVIVPEFSLSKSQKRIAKRNADLRVERSEHIEDEQAFELYRRYIEIKHADGDMYPPDREQYSTFLNNGLGCTRYYRFYLGEQLLAVTVADQMDDGLAAVYTFYEPSEERRSLGTLAVLYQIKEARRLGLQHVYLGYWIRDCGKMSYKTRFQPLELLIDGTWQAANAKGDIIARS
jgi:arginine-tRNA-protein transferase